jgi:hypothetical protein
MTKPTTIRLALALSDARTIGLCNQASAIIAAYEPSMNATEQASFIPAIHDALEAIGGADAHADQVEALRMAVLRELHTIAGRITWVLAA